MNCALSPFGEVVGAFKNICGFFADLDQDIYPEHLVQTDLEEESGWEWFIKKLHKDDDLGRAFKYVSFFVDGMEDGSVGFRSFLLKLSIKNLSSRSSKELSKHHWYRLSEER